MYESFHLNHERYYYGGEETADWLIGLLERHIKLDDKCILDWGCGPARVIRHFPKLTANKCHYFGTDYNKKSIEWNTKNIENVKFNHNSLKAELPYESGFFDVIYGISIFTHLSEKMHYEWFNELKRIIKNDGLLLLTMQGENFKQKLSEQEKDKFDNGELVIRGNVKEGHRIYSAFHPDKFLEDLFSEMQVLEKIIKSPDGKSYIPQDTWILKK